MMLYSLSIAICLSSALLLAQEHTPQNEKNPLAGQRTAIEAGKKTFGQACQACHGGDAAGSQRGPALATGVFRHGSKDGEIFLNIRNGITGTQMPPFSGFSTEQAWQVVSYLRSLSATGAKPGETVPGDAVAGQKLFFGTAGCAGCHEVNGRGGIVGPDLSAAAATPAETLMQKILDPNTSPVPGAEGTGGLASASYT